MARQRPDYYDDLEFTLSEVWDQLARGANDRQSAFHEPTFVTASDGAPSARTLILRRCDRNARTLHFHTDRRSAKIAELRDAPMATVHVWDRKRSIQVRLTTKVELLESGPVVDGMWDATSGRGRAMFGMKPAPGSRVDEPPLPPEDSDRAADDPPRDEPKDGAARANFVVLQAHVRRIEWLFLFHEGHRRAEFVWSEGDADWRQSWLVP